MKTFILVALFIGVVVIGWVFAKVVWALLPIILLGGFCVYVYNKFFKEPDDDHDHR